VRFLNLQFDHGLGDCSNFAHVLQLYRRRSYDIAICSDPNKALIWRAVGASSPNGARLIRHDWPHPPNFNRPDIGSDATSNKIAYNINRRPLPPVGHTYRLWDEVCKVNLESSVEPLIGRQEKDESSRFLRHLPRPIVLLHTSGATSPESKSLPDDVANELYRALLRCFPGSLVLLDWDYRVRQPPHARIRHIRQDWGHITLSHLAALMRESALLVGIDSGPYHFASLTQTPALGVFHRHYPSCVALPRARNVNMTPAAFTDVNITRRAKWNIIEYPGEMPTADDITLQASRMLRGPRYGLPLGRDVMLQQWVRDWCYQSSSEFPIIDRSETLDFLLRQISRRFVDPQILALRCQASAEAWSTGNAAYIFGAYLEGAQKGAQVLLDNDRERYREARAALRDWHERTTVIFTENEEWLSRRGECVDVLYYGSDLSPSPDQAERAMLETQQVEARLSEDAIIVYDSSPWQAGWIGTGAKAIPYLIDRGWRVVAAGYQTLLSRGEEGHK
jgi:hypothetical protein